MALRLLPDWAALGLVLYVLIPVMTARGEGPAPRPPAPEPAALDFFEKSVRPILAERCQACHGPSKQKGGLRLDSREALLRGGETGPAVVPGLPDESLLIEAVNYGDDLRMPPKSKIPASEVGVLARWVQMGVPWTADPQTSAASSGTRKAFDLKARRDAHWAWRKVEAGEPPGVKDTAWPRDPVDRFLLARLEAQGLRPAPDADRRVVIRRLSFDLTGLPPTPGEVDNYLGDRRPDADERLVDRLLASPRFGERWGRHWLDLVRYAESRGHEFDPTIPNAWQYRDYVIRALNADVPYDRFVVEHLAGDLAEAPRLDPVTGANESVLGTGFWLLGEEVHSPVDIRQDETDRMDNRLDVMSKTFLGLTVACARCHDHKFDAISQNDYYALTGFLISSGYRQVRFTTSGREREAAASLQALRDTTRARVLASAARVVGPGIGHLARDLLAARSRLGGPSPGVQGAGAGTGCDRLDRWANELNRAKADPEHPLHGFAASTADPLTEDGRALAGRLKTLSGSKSTAPLPLKSGRVIVHYGSLTALARLQDGFAFGLRPDRPGDLSVSGSPGAGGFVVSEVGAARRDRAFSRLALAEVTERDHARIGTWDRAGQTLRTPEFVVGSGRLWYLARGAGRAYASVNAHLIVAGPLHAKVLTEWTARPEGWRWVRQDLTAYKGNRAHVEFSPFGAGEMAVAAVVESEEEPPPIEGTDPVWTRILEEPGIGSVEGLATAYQSLTAEAARRMESDTIHAFDDARPVARLAGWLLRNPDLFAAKSAESLRASVRADAERLRDAEARVARDLASPAPSAPALFDGTGVNETLLIRGSSRTPGPEVPRRFLEAIVGDRPLFDPSEADPGSGRRELARQVVEPGNPFASRVIVNRAWQHLFGRGLVASVDNFGVLGEPPSHPELLDHLADRFTADGWSLKRLIRRLVLSRAYRMSSRPDSQADQADPDNRLLHRMSIRRLEAEPIRDAILAVSGRLDGRMSGPSVPVHLTPFMSGRGRPAASGPLDGDGRRSIYLTIRRNFLSPMMLAFDAPIPFTTIGKRNVSNVPAQALILMNDPFVAGQARLWSERLLSETPGAPEARVGALYKRAFARPADPQERAEALEFLESEGREMGLEPDAWKDDPRVWADLAHVLLNSKEFIFIE